MTITLRVVLGAILLLLVVLGVAGTLFSVGCLLWVTLADILNNLF